MSYYRIDAWQPSKDGKNLVSCAYDKPTATEFAVVYYNDCNSRVEIECENLTKARRIQYAMSQARISGREEMKQEFRNLLGV